ncbi:hypothetical protein ACMYR2_1828 [Nitrobacter sp. TKz-YC01]
MWWVILPRELGVIRSTLGHQEREEPDQNRLKWGCEALSPSPPRGLEVR